MDQSPALWYGAGKTNQAIGLGRGPDEFAGLFHRFDAVDQHFDRVVEAVERDLCRCGHSVVQSPKLKVVGTRSQLDGATASQTYWPCGPFGRLSRSLASWTDCLS